MCYDVGAPPGRILQVRCSETIIDIEDHILSGCEFAQPFKVNEIQGRIRWCLHKDHACVWKDLLLPRFRSIYIGITVRYSKPRKDRVEYLMRRAEYGTAGEHVISGLEKSRHAAIHRGHAGGGGDAVLGPFEHAKFFNKFVRIRIRISAVNIAGDLICKHRAGLLGTVEYKTGSKV